MKTRFLLNKIIQTTNKNTLLDNYPVFEVKIRDNIDTTSSSTVEELYLPLPLHIACKLFQEDTNSVYFSENNFRRARNDVVGGCGAADRVAGAAS